MQKADRARMVVTPGMLSVVAAMEAVRLGEAGPESDFEVWELAQFGERLQGEDSELGRELRGVLAMVRGVS